MPEDVRDEIYATFANIDSKYEELKDDNLTQPELRKALLFQTRLAEVRDKYKEEDTNRFKKELTKSTKINKTK